jgi:hypothetical protein
MMLKQQIVETILDMPENISIEDIMYRLYIMDKHHKALMDIEAGRVYSRDEVKKELGKH